jgi:hypothetical protein
MRDADVAVELATRSRCLESTDGMADAGRVGRGRVFATDVSSIAVEAPGTAPAVLAFKAGVSRDKSLAGIVDSKAGVTTNEDTPPSAERVTRGDDALKSGALTAIPHMNPIAQRFIPTERIPLDPSVDAIERSGPRTPDALTALWPARRACCSRASGTTRLAPAES